MGARAVRQLVREAGRQLGGDVRKQGSWRTGEQVGRQVGRQVRKKENSDRGGEGRRQGGRQARTGRRAGRKHVLAWITRAARYLAVLAADQFSQLVLF